MISSVCGTVSALRLDSVVLTVSGLGLALLATPTTLAKLRLGVEVELASSLVVREDSLTLYGFADADEREVFEAVQTVSGVGPRLALAILAVLTPEELRRAVATEDLAVLTSVPGIGRKGAQRMLLELGDRLGPPHGALPQPGSRPLVAAARAPGMDADGQQVVDALVGLGWSTRQATEAVAAETAAASEAGDVDVPALLRATLARLSSVGVR